jgi:hypothetical protein
MVHSPATWQCGAAAPNGSHSGHTCLCGGAADARSPS